MNFQYNLANISILRYYIKELWHISRGGNAEYGPQWQAPYFKLNDISIYVKEIESKYRPNSSANVIIYKVLIDIERMGIDIRSKFVERISNINNNSKDCSHSNLCYSDIKYYMPFSYFITEEFLSDFLRENNNSVLVINEFQKKINDNEKIISPYEDDLEKHFNPCCL